ncbi:MAG TPA: hypothetical protein VGX48_08435 [Pyrinomonadaceae bacterium]|nr:hypothetical protein [Pyrinomonadaceae bacterium]
MRKMRNLKLLLLTASLCSLIAAQVSTGRVLTPSAARVQLPPPRLSHDIPPEVEFGAGVTSPETARPFFDYFSWQSFVALNWPSAVGADGRPVRGVPNTGAGVGDAGKRVWESYKADWELFRPGGAEPTAWSSYDLNPRATAENPCGNVGDSKMLAMITKMDSVIDGINQAFSGPLIDQSRNYVRYEIHVNKAYYEKVADPNVKWYLFDRQSRDPNRPNVFPDGVIEIKAAWKELVEGRDDPNRYYTVDALIVEPGTPRVCRPARMGLVGFHIANKVVHLREWVWSTFEHVDNVPEGAPVPGDKYSFNNGTATPASPNGFDHRPAKLSDAEPLPQPNDPRREPVQVTRFTPVSPAGQVTPTTDEINAQWQQALSGTIWRFYKLVSTQWPTVSDGASFKVKRSSIQPGSSGVFPQDSGLPFPAENVANVTMETYFQKGQSCMRCHYNASQDDFSFLLSERAFRPSPPLPLSMNVAERLRRITEDRMSRSPTLRNLRDEVQRQQ